MVYTYRDSHECGIISVFKVTDLTFNNIWGFNYLLGVLYFILIFMHVYTYFSQGERKGHRVREN